MLVRVEAYSKPLVSKERRERVGDAEEALTPGHFLTGHKLTNIPEGPEPTEKRLKRIFEQQQQDLLDQFWKK
ncbi:hypothetical protein TNCT_619171 [Trichonephila clavata]|uniref:Uncharacterized protein n=1 Tax=Trichonephila clavata TaxID=2740835 RepID=A0A8X6HS99_TRICU|nr:hypothetical protein TNCT_619171 [Trichonephila clavata]